LVCLNRGDAVLAIAVVELSVATEAVKIEMAFVTAASGEMKAAMVAKADIAAAVLWASVGNNVSDDGETRISEGEDDAVNGGCDELDRGERYKSIPISFSLSSSTSHPRFLVLFAGVKLTDVGADDRVWLKGIVVVTEVKMVLSLL
jgi:hypothetical protein